MAKAKCEIYKASVTDECGDVHFNHILQKDKTVKDDKYIIKNDDIDLFDGLYITAKVHAPVGRDIKMDVFINDVKNNTELIEPKYIEGSGHYYFKYEAE